MPQDIKIDKSDTNPNSNEQGGTRGDQVDEIVAEIDCRTEI